MRRPLSIRSRFLLISLVAVPVALVLAALFMVSLFADNLERRLEAELDSHINSLAASIRIDAQGEIERPAVVMDRRFTQAYGGLYWQIGDEASPARYRSGSLWDYSLPRPDEIPSDGAVHRYEIVGPDATRLLAQERQVLVSVAAGLKPVRIVVAADTKPLEDAGRGFALDILPYLAGLALFLIAASVIQVTFGLKPVSALTAGLDRIRERRGGRLEGVLPLEFEPVEAAVNRLLDAQAQSLSKARARAGDLAHGLKTPLTVLSNDALTLREKGEAELAEEIEKLVLVMRAHVDHEVTRSRIVADATMRQSDADMDKIVSQVVTTLKRTPQGEALAWKVELGDPAQVPVDPNDLRELIGNIVENAAKWAVSDVRISWDQGRLCVSDDGPGVDPSKIDRLTERGLRLDSQMPGTGLGLAIVKEISEIYGLGLKIENRDTRGLMVTVSFTVSSTAGAAPGATSM